MAFSAPAGSTTDLISGLQGWFAEDLLCRVRENMDQLGHLRRLAHCVCVFLPPQELRGAPNSWAAGRPMHLAARHPCLKCAVGRASIPDLRLLCDLRPSRSQFFFWAALDQSRQRSSKNSETVCPSSRLQPPSPAKRIGLRPLLSIVRDGRTQPSTPGPEHCVC